MVDKYVQKMLAFSDKFQPEKEYWVGRLSGLAEICGFPVDFHPRANSTAEEAQPARSELLLPEPLSRKLLAISNHSATGVFLLFFSGINYLLYHYTGNEDLIVGMPALRQKRGEVAPVNELLPIRNRITSRFSFKEFLAEMKQSVNDAAKNQNYPLNQLFNAQNVNLNVHGAYSVILPVVTMETLHDSGAINYMTAARGYPIVFNFEITAQVISCRLEYDANLYKPSTIDLIWRNLLSFMEMATRNPQLRLEEIVLPDSEEMEKTRYGFKIIYLNRENIYPPVTVTPENADYPLSSGQKRLYEFNRLNPGGILYNRTAVTTIQGKIDRVRLEEAFRNLVKRHEVLRSSFMITGNGPVQKISPEFNLRIDYQEASEEQVKELTAAFVRPFNLDEGPLLRVLLLKRTDAVDNYVLLYDTHQIICDGISLELLRRDLFYLYSGKELPELKIQYKDFAVWQEQFFKTGLYAKQADFWREYFNDEISVINMPADFSRPVVYSFAGGDFDFVFEPELAEALAKLAARTGTTLFMIFLSAFHILIAKYTGQQDIVTGSQVDGRKMPELVNLAGMFANTVLIKNNVDGALTYQEFLDVVKINILKINENQDFPFEKLADELGIEGDESRNFLFNLMFDLRHVDQSMVQLEGLQMETREIKTGFTQYDLALIITDEPDRVSGNFEYSAQLFLPETIMRIAGHYGNILRKVTANPAMKIAELEILSAEEKRQILVDFNDTAAECPFDRTIHELFQEQVDRAPDNIAIVERTPFGEQRLTYREVDEQANQLANFLIREQRLSAGALVCILLKNSIEQIIAVLGVLKAGAAFIPTDPELPEERVKAIINDAEVQVLISTVKHLDGLNRMLCECKSLDTYLCMDTNELPSTEAAVDQNFHRYGRSILENYSKNRPSVIVTSGDPAYAIFTSGTTGHPKGVLIEHRSMVNLAFWHNRYYEVTATDRATRYAGFGFDASIWELFPYLIAGAAVHVIGDEMRLDIHKLNQYFEEQKITVSFLPTQFCEQFIQLENTSLRLLLTGGDKLRCFTKCNYELINNYGPTEYTVVTTSFIVRETCHNIPIGKPVANTRLYVLDRDNNLQPAGVPGELCVAGAGLAKGYLNRPELTAEKFISNPFHSVYSLQFKNSQLSTINSQLKNDSQPSNDCQLLTDNDSQLLTSDLQLSTVNSQLSTNKLYRTGDLVRWRMDGNIEYLGRIDDQVKIRGFRIELGEIESCLLKHERIREALVIARQDAKVEKYLCAYVVTAGEVTSGELRETLARQLPDYMIPSYFVPLTRMPLNASGKIDRKALPAPANALATGVAYAPPTNETEAKLAALWQEVLGMPKIGIHDNFFELGGHSLQAMQLVLKIQKELDREITINNFFQSLTISRLSETLRLQENGLYPKVKKAAVSSFYPVSSSQKRMFIANQMAPEDINYNAYVSYLIEGDLDRARLENSFQALIRRHESLRTSFELMDDEVIQKVHREFNLQFNYSEAEEENAAKLLREFIRPFDLSRPPLVRVGLFKLKEAARAREIRPRYILLIDTHHIVMDAVSMNVLIKELAELYAGRIYGELAVQYKDYAVWHKELCGTEVLQKQELYWREVFKEQAPALCLPWDYTRPAVKANRGKIILFDLNKKLTKELNALASQNNCTFYLALLAAYYILLAKYTGQEDITVGAPVAGRSRAEFADTIGVFINTLALRNYPEGNKTFLGFLHEVKENVFKAFENQDYPFDELVDRLNIFREVNRNPLFDTMFDFIERPQLRIDGLDVKPYFIEEQASLLDLVLEADETGERIEFWLHYDPQLFKPETMEKLVRDYCKTIAALVKNPMLKIKDLSIE